VTFEFSLSCLSARSFFNFFYIIWRYIEHLARASPIAIFAKRWRAGSCNTSITRRNRSPTSAEASLDPLRLFFAFLRRKITFRIIKNCSVVSDTGHKLQFLSFDEQFIQISMILNERFKLLTDLSSYLICKASKFLVNWKSFEAYSCTFSKRFSNFTELNKLLHYSR